MHDPMVVAFEVPAPIPKRDKWRETHYKGRKWGWTRRRRTNPENLGEPVFSWWRPDGWEFALGGRCYSLRKVATVWHVEPGGADAFEVCSHRRQKKDGTWEYHNRWKWHIHHWHIQIMPLQGLRARLFDRCQECGRKGRPNVSHQWDGKRLGWWKFKSREGLYHHECSSLVQLRRTKDEDAEIIRHLVAWLVIESDRDREEVVDQLTGTRTSPLTFHQQYRLTRMLGYERDDNYKLVAK